MNIDTLPSKVLMKDGLSGSPFIRYYIKKKNLFYYKSRDNSTEVSVPAKLLNQQFEQIITTLEYDKKHKLQLKNILAAKLKQHFTNNISDEKLNKKKDFSITKPN